MLVLTNNKIRETTQLNPRISQGHTLCRWRVTLGCACEDAGPTIAAVTGLTVVLCYYVRLDPGEMALRAVYTPRLRHPLSLCVRAFSGEPGSGVGHGGGSGGTIRDAGGSLGKREAAFEEQYFRKVDHQQMQKIRAGMEVEVDFHKEQIEAHQEAIKRHHRNLDDLNMSIRNLDARDKLMSDE